MMIDVGSSLADIVNRVPGAASVLESFGLDYCCGGRRSLADACATLGSNTTSVLNALNEIDLTAVPDWAAMHPSELVDHIESTHHRYLHVELPRLDRLAEKVASVHGARHPELLDVLADFRELRDDLEPHLVSEEEVLFPMIRELAGPGGPTGIGRRRVCTSIMRMMAEHDAVGVLLERLRARTGDHLVPVDACASYRSLYDGLAALEFDTHLHVHKENNVLIPAVADLERREPTSRNR